MKYTKALLLFLIALVHTYKLQKHVLTLVSDDFPDILTQFPQLVIYFCAPEVSSCKNTTPIYHSIAKQFNQSNSPIRFAKINANEYSTVRAVYQIRFYPTLIYFVKGQKLQYHGQISKEAIVAWLNKKISNTVAKIDPSQLESLTNNQNVNIVFHGDLTSNQHRVTFQQLALTDDYNRYYNLQITELAAGTVQIFRPFGEPVSTVIDKSLKTWISRYSRPAVSRFDNQTFSELFYDKATAVILFEPQNPDQGLLQAFEQVAQNVRLDQKKQILFISLEASSEHHHRLSNITKIDPSQSPIIIFHAAKGYKYVLAVEAADLTSQTILSFIADFEGGKLKKYKITDEVVYPKKVKNDDQL